MSDTKKAAVYCRVACADNAKIAAQENEMLRFAEQNGYGDCVCYRDNGKSGVTLDRPGFAALMADIESGKIGCVIVQDIARVCRDYIQFEKWLNAMEGKGIRLIAVNDTFDSAKVWENEQLRRFFNRFQKERKRTHSERTKMGIAYAKRRRLSGQE
ncbi:hypothetical protein FACS1894202_10510 [Clostridia bacterium]|nr:hypothetical protein FACS1894202_10510 [Clostridia bacterium]